VTCRPGTSVLVLAIETLFCPHTPRPADEDGLPTSPVELTYARASPTFGQFNRPSGAVADRPSELSRNSSTSEDALAVMRSMAGRWDDTHIAAPLNRMGLQTGQGKSRNAKRVGALRRVLDIHAYRSAEKNGEWLTMREAAKELGVTSHVIRRLIQSQVLAAEQVVPGAPFQIKGSDLRVERVAVAIRRKATPCRAEAQTKLQMFTDT